MTPPRKRPYEAYLRSAHWRDVKVRYRASDRPQDCICGETENLQLHHLTYARLGHERLDDLRLLCSGCHVAVHVLEKRGDASLDPADLTDAGRAGQHEQVKLLQQAERERDRDRELALFERMSLPGKLRYVKRKAARLNVDISSSLRVIDRHICDAEWKVGLLP